MSVEGVGNGYSELQRRQDALARNRENRGRFVSVSMTLETTGVGVVESADRFDFGVIYIDRPRMHYGNEVEADDLRNLYGLLDADDLPLPHCTGYVVAWDQDENEHYVGCWVAVKVTQDVLLLENASLVITHHFDFTAVGLKTIPHDPND